MVRKFLSVICLCGSAFVLSACGTEIPSEDVAYRVGPGMGGVFEVQLKDGTRCAVLAMPYKGGIDCNWDNE